MTRASSHEQHLQNLRRWRNKPAPDLTLGKLSEYVAKQIVKPHAQLGKLVEVWRGAVPASLAERTALTSLVRGVLTVHVTDSATLYELDRLLRSGLETRVRQTPGAAVRKVKCIVASF